MIEQAVSVYRGELLESTHAAHVAVVNNKGELLYYYGDPNRQTFARSSMKPFQAVPIIETGTADAFNFQPKDLSLNCASHSGEIFHRENVLDILNRINLPEDALQCGTHIPRDLEGYKALIRAGGELTPVFSNCSGKHSGMLATAVHLKEDVASYREINHPVQQRILDVIADICDYPKEKIGLSVDGCGVPVHRVPLANTAFGFARLADPETVSTEERKNALTTIRQAMTAHPEMVGGTDRFDTDLMRVYNGRLVAKAGAEAVQCIGDAQTGIGIAIKIEDGGPRATSVVAMEVLKQLGIGTPEQFEQLKSYAEPAVENMRKDKIGVMVPTFKLQKL
jgi:L-asparaginase II